MIVLYTTIFADSDVLKPRPAGADLAVCYVDRPVAASLGWTIVELPPPADPRRTAWRMRALSHLTFPDATVVIWADASFAICNLPRLVEDAGVTSLAGLRHPERSSCYEEGAELVALGQSDRRAVEAQLASYRAAHFAPHALTAANILVRRHTPAVVAFNEYWASELQRWPDDNAQLSLDFSAWRADLAVQYLDGTYTANPYMHFDMGDHHARRRPYVPWQ